MNPDSAVIIAPIGRDAKIAAALLAEADIAATPLSSVSDLIGHGVHDVGFVLITEEALDNTELHALTAWLAKQSEWSDLPFILLTSQGGGLDRNPAARRYLDILGNVTLIERPFHPTTLVSLARAATRARSRQYDARGRLETIATSQRRLNLAMAAGKLGAWLIDARERTLDTSEQFKAHFGYDADAPFSYDDLISAVHPDDWEIVQAKLTTGRATTGTFDIEYRCFWPDKSEHWIEMRGRVDIADGQGPISLSGVSLDTTARKDAEAALKKSEERFKAAVAAVHGVLWTNNAVGEMAGEQPAWAALTGQTYDQYQGYGWASAVHPDDAQASIDSWNQAVATRSRYIFEHRVYRQNHDWGHFAICAVPVLDPDGSIREWVGVHTDITEQRHSERALAELADSLEQRVVTATAALSDSQSRLRSIFESSFQYAGEVSPDGIVLDANATSLAGIGSTIDQIVGTPFHSSPWFNATPGMSDQVEQAIARVAKGETFRSEVEVNLPIGSRIFDFSMRPVLSANGTVITIVPEAIDITDRRQAEERLLQSQKLETIGQLTGGVAHDFNNLLTPIVSSLEVLHAKAEGDAAAQRWASVGLESAERARVLVDRLLSFARRQTLESRPVDIAALVAGMQDLIARSIGSSIDFTVSSAPDLPPAVVDHGQLELSLLNLCINARDAMPHGGSIALTVDLDESAGPFEETQAPSYIRISVRDTGTGMDQEMAKRAIEPFFTTKAVGEGTGLGLSMVHGLVGQLGGGMAIESEVGLGTTVTLWLPVATDALSTIIESPEPQRAEIQQGAKLLLVDDEPIVRFVTAELLREAGYEVVEAASGQKARDLVDQGFSPDLLITDQLMPNMKGTELAAALLLARPDLCVLVATGYSNLPDMPYPTISKPFTTADLIDKVNLILGHANSTRLMNAD